MMLDKIPRKIHLCLLSVRSSNGTLFKQINLFQNEFHLFFFFVPDHRRDIWIRNAGFQDTPEKFLNQDKKKKRFLFCQLHFDPRFITISPDSKAFLSRQAVPILYESQKEGSSSESEDELNTSTETLIFENDDVTADEIKVEVINSDDDEENEEDDDIEIYEVPTEVPEVIEKPSLKLQISEVCSLTANQSEEFTKLWNDETSSGKF